MDQKTPSEHVNASRVVIIGSGFGGSVTASRLTEAGFDVTILERGPWRDTLPVKNAGIKERKVLPRSGGIFSVLRSINLPVGPKKGFTLNKNGYLDLFITPKVKVVCTSNVGGGSHIWGAVMVTAPEGFWNDRAEGLSDDIMAEHYLTTRRELAATYPEDSSNIPNATSHSWNDKPFFTPLKEDEVPDMGILFPDNEQEIKRKADHNGILREEIHYHQFNGKFGSPNASKSTVDALYLLPALQKGLKIKDSHLVKDVRCLDSGAYRVNARDLKNGRDQNIVADIVIVAAGTMNTMRLLMASRETGGLGSMPALGSGFGTNGDCVAKWQVNDTPARDGCLGTPVHGRVKINEYEDGLYVLLAGTEIPPLPSFMAIKARKDASSNYEIVAMAQDKADGRVTYDGGRLNIDYDFSTDSSYQRIYEAYRTLEKQSGWKLKFNDESLLIAHPMGGTRIADDPAQGVVNGHGEVHSNPGLYVADASAFPQPTGVPPSLSIAAWASHVAAGIISANKTIGKTKPSENGENQ